MQTPETRNDLMTGLQQMALSNKVARLLEDFRQANGLSPFAILYYLVAYTWAYARACQWTSANLKDYAARQYEACERQEARAAEPRKLTI